MVEKTNRFEFRRRPARGREKDSEPFFFALPPSEEIGAVKLAGRWELMATRSGSTVFTGLDIATDQEKISARFDQNTDYRFAHIMEGTFSSDKLELRVEYIMDAYVLSAKWQEGKLHGEWRHVDDSERGAWEATRPGGPSLPDQEAVALYEWRNASDDARRYQLEGEQMELGWERASRPLCRVWRVRANPNKQRLE
jgi:hypothetical protein